MKTIDVPAQSKEINSFLDDAREEELLARAADGTEFLIRAVDDFDLEIARTRQNAELMALLDERSREGQTFTLEEVEKKLGLNE